MRITIISPFSFGYIDSLVTKLEEYPMVDLLYINTNNFQYHYRSFYERLNNLYLKSFSKRNLKKENVTKEIKKLLSSQTQQDIILVIRPDKLEIELLKWLKNNTNTLISFYFDGNKSIPEQIKLIPLFDKVYSYDKQDVQQYGLNFITNFIPYDVELEKTGVGVFNISSYDKRFATLENIANQLKELNIPINIIVRKEKPLPSETIKIVRDYISLEEVMDYLKGASILLDIQKENQQGLSFRVFESLGYDKKLITTNKDIVNYDFFNPDNILVIDMENPLISKDFLTNPYVPVSEKIKNTYRRDYWIKKVFDISKKPGHHEVSIDL